MLVDRVEKCLKIYLAFLFGLIQRHLDVSSGNQFPVKSILIHFVAVIEVQFFRDFSDCGIQQNLLSVKYDDWINDVFKVTDLMGRDQDYRILTGLFGDRFPELCL